MVTNSREQISKAPQVRPRLSQEQKRAVRLLQVKISADKDIPVSMQFVINMALGTLWGEYFPGLDYPDENGNMADNTKTIKVA
jgi:hypothetical protein